jgi:prephenate dehydrogenase
MGGSLALALRASAARGGPAQRLIGVSRSQETLAAATAAGAVDATCTNLADGVAEADLVVLATPARAILRQLPLVGQAARPGAIVLDLGSTKAQICAALDALPPALQPIGGHPMCGKETAGFAAAEAGLFRAKTFVLCPLPRTTAQTLASAQELVQALGARPLTLTPQAHDRAVAAISHLPYAAAASLVAALDAVEGETSLAWQLAASGFRDTSRLAASDVDMMLDILMTNPHAIIDWLDRYTDQLGRLRQLLAAADEAGLRDHLTTIQARRARWHAAA